MFGLQPVECLRIAEEGQHSIADQIGSCLLPADHRNDEIGDDFFLGQPVSIHLCGEKVMYEAFSRACSLFANSVAK